MSLGRLQTTGEIGSGVGVTRVQDPAQKKTSNDISCLLHANFRWVLVGHGRTDQNMVSSFPECVSSSILYEWEEWSLKFEGLGAKRAMK